MRSSARVCLVSWRRRSRTSARRSSRGGLQGGLDGRRRDPGGEAWLDRPRAGGGVIYSDTLSLRHECQVLEAAHESWVRTPGSYGYLENLTGREAFVMERGKPPVF